MLCQFRVKNFMSYRDDAVLDMEAAKIEEFSDTLLPPPCDKFRPVVPLAAIFGPNAGGKSNAVNALAYLVSRVVVPVVRSTGEGRFFGMVLKNYSPFLLDEASRSQPTEFELVFHAKHAQYHYCLSLFNSAVERESLYYIKTPCERRRSVKLFERSRDGGIELGAALKKANTDKVSPTIPYLSFLAISGAFPEIDEVMDWFQSCYIQNYAVLDSDHQVSELLEEPKLKPLFLHFLGAMGIPISDYTVRNAKDNVKSGEETALEVTTTHTVNGTSYSLDLGAESEGTIKILSALPGIVLSLLTGGLVLFDEFDAKLHPSLLRFLIGLYANPKINTNHAQLIFTCHDISIMRNDCLRRDEIWFAALNRDSASELWNLYFDILDEQGNHVNKNAAYDRQYLMGRYGADPYLKRMTEWGDNHAAET